MASSLPFVMKMYSVVDGFTIEAFLIIFCCCELGDEAGQLETVEMETGNGKQKRSKLDANEC